MAESQLQVLKQTLNTPKMVEQVSKALTKHVSAEKFIRTAMTVVSQNPELVKCDRATLMSSIMSCAGLGLMPESFLGEAYMIPFKGKVTLQVGYKGLIALARRSGEIVSIESGVVYTKDDYDLILGDESIFTIKPYLLGDPGPALFAWCVITLKDGGKQREIMPVDQIETIRKAAPSGNSPAWKNSWGEMARKTVIKRALKSAPRSTEMSQAISIDDGIYSDRVVSLNPEGGLIVDHASVDEKKEPAKRKSRLAKLAEDGAESPEPQQEAAIIDADTGEAI